MGQIRSLPSIACLRSQRPRLGCWTAGAHCYDLCPGAALGPWNLL